MDSTTMMSSTREEQSVPQQVQQVLARAELLEQILCRCDPLDLAGSAALVCRQWRELVLHSDAVWAQHLDSSLLQLHRGLHPAGSAAGWQPAGSPGQHAALSGSATAASGPTLSLMQLFMACHSRNLLRNPDFSRSVNIASNPLLKSRRHWVVKDSGSPVVFENPPQNVRPEPDSQCFPPPPLPYARDVRLANQPLASALQALQRLVAPEQPGCVATTQDWGELVQVIDLQDELVSRGLTPLQAQEVLQAGLPLGFSLMVASHHAHGGTFAVGIMLDDGKGAVPSMQSFVKRPSSYHFYSQKRYLPPGSGWQRFAHVVPSCPPGCRRAVLLLRGRMSGGSGNNWLPSVFLDPHNAQRSDVPQGTKFASAELTLLSSRLVPGFGENSMSSKWQRPPMEAPQQPNVVDHSVAVTAGGVALAAPQPHQAPVGTAAALVMAH